MRQLRLPTLDIPRLSEARKEAKTEGAEPGQIGALRPPGINSAQLLFVQDYTAAEGYLLPNMLSGHSVQQSQLKLMMDTHTV